MGTVRRGREQAALPIPQEDTMDLRFQPMDQAHARSLVTWQYEPPYDFYSIPVEAAEEVVPFFVDPANQYYAITDQQGSVVAFCCFGADARVPGADYRDDAL